MDLTPGPERPTAEPFRHGETLTPARGEAVLTAAAAELLSVGSDLVPDWMGSNVGRWLIGLADAVGVTGSDIGDEMLGGLALANIVLRAREGDPAYRAGREDAAKAVPAAQAAAVRGAGDGIREAMRQTSVLLSGPQIAQLLDGIAREIERGEPTNLGRSEPGDSQHTQDGGE